MSVSKGFNGDDVQDRIEAAEESAGNTPDYIISDNGHNLVKGITGSRHIRHADISHSMGVILRNVYEKQSDFVEFTTLLGKKTIAVSSDRQGIPAATQHESHITVYEHVLMGILG